MAPNERLAALSAAGVSIWLDDLSRERLTSGNLQELITDYTVVGVTTNPTIFAAALANGESYDEQVRELAARGASVDDAVREITVADVRTPATCSAAPGRPPAASTAGCRSRSARCWRATPRPPSPRPLDLWKAVDRPNLLVKIPATEEGLPAITSALAEGVSVNVTLIFSVERYRDVMAAYLDGLERAAANGQNARRHRLGGQLLRLPRRLRDRQAAGEDRHRRGAGAARQGRHRELPAGLRGVRGGLPGHAVGAAGRAGRQARSGRCGPRPG